MQRAKAAATSFLSRDGKHKTTVEQDVNAAVTEEHVKPHEHETVLTAVDREVHQDHHQTRIQPIQAKETLAETSKHVMAPTVHKTFDHTNEAETRQKLEAERAAFTNTSVTHETTHSTTMAPAVTAERVHHHVHEHIQPVIHKEVIAPHVVHKTVPIHETHHAAPVHHEVTTLPVKTLEEFQATGGSLQSENSHVLREYEGCPGPYNKDKELPSSALGSGHGHTHGQHATTATTMHQTTSSASARSDSDAGSGEYMTSSKTRGLGATGAAGAATAGVAGTSSTERTPRTGENLATTTSTTSAGSAGERPHKPSLRERLDPRIDADGDGKKGILS
jgi:hypothetical protein